MRLIRERPAARVRNFELTDLDRILAIEAASFGEDAWDAKLFREYHRKCGDLFVVAMRGRHIAGYSITCAGVRSAELASIAVHPLDRRRGVGEVLLNWTLAELRARSVRTWWLMVRAGNRSGAGLYENFGFTRTRLVKRYYGPGPGHDGWRMRYSITAITAGRRTIPATKH